MSLRERSRKATVSNHFDRDLVPRFYQSGYSTIVHCLSARFYVIFNICFGVVFAVGQEIEVEFNVPRYFIAVSDTANEPVVAFPLGHYRDLTSFND